MGGLIQKNQTVHHVNGNRIDNSPENLQIGTGQNGSGVSYICAECGSEDIICLNI